MYELSAAGRMDRILTAVLASSPDVIMLQEVVVEMYKVLQRRLQGRGWSIGRRRRHAEEYFNVITTRSAPEKTTSYCFSTSQQGRHLVTTRRGHWSLSNVHAESGGSQENRDERAAQLLYMSRMHEFADGRISVLAGDFNARDGEDHGLKMEGWRDVWGEVVMPRERGNGAWTWRRGQNTARYDRVYVHGGGVEVKCLHLSTISSILGTCTDHVALCVVLRRSAEDAVSPAATDAESVSASSSARSIGPCVDMNVDTGAEWTARACQDTGMHMCEDGDRATVEHVTASSSARPIGPRRVLPWTAVACQETGTHTCEDDTSRGAHPILAIANAVSVLDVAFRDRANSCLHSSPDQFAELTCTLSWFCAFSGPPPEGVFNVKRKGVRSGDQCSSKQELEQDTL